MGSMTMAKKNNKTWFVILAIIAIILLMGVKKEGNEDNGDGTGEGTGDGGNGGTGGGSVTPIEGLSSCEQTAISNGYSNFHSPLSQLSCMTYAFGNCNSKGMSTNGIAYNDNLQCCVWNCKSTKYLCCQAMGVKACYQNACPPAGILINEYTSLQSCQSGCGTSCTDTDGDDKDTVGHVTDAAGTYYDQCYTDGSNQLTEYICRDGATQGIVEQCDAGERCMQTRSGGHCIPVHVWNPGDIVFTGSGSGSLAGATVGNLGTFDLADYGFATGGNCQLGARIQTSWAYATGLPTCTGLQGMEGIKWDFYDSAGLEYTRTDPNPIGLGVDLHPTQHYLEWDGNTDWYGTISKTLNLPACDISYEYSVEIYIYSCT